MMPFRVMDKDLRLHLNIDCFCSGTKTVTLVKQGQDLVIGNIGDSRAILGTRDPDDTLIAVPLTVWISNPIFQILLRTENITILQLGSQCQGELAKAQQSCINVLFTREVLMDAR